MPTTPDLAAAYGNFPAVVTNAWIEAIVTIDPRRWPRILGSTYFADSQTDLRSMPRKCSHSASVMVAASKDRSMPAFATSTSIVPNRSTANAVASATCSSDVTSQGVNATGAAPSASAPATSRPSSSSTSTKSTEAPAACRRSTHARPMPRAPPVTNATRPSRVTMRLPVQERAVGGEHEVRSRRSAGMRGGDVLDELDPDPGARRRVDVSAGRHERHVHDLSAPGHIAAHLFEDQEVRQSQREMDAHHGPDRSVRVVWGNRNERGLGQRRDAPYFGHAAAVADVRLDDGAGPLLEML